MKKNVIAWICFTLCGCMLTACGENSASVAENETTTAATTLTEETTTVESETETETTTSAAATTAETTTVTTTTVTTAEETTTVTTTTAASQGFSNSMLTDMARIYYGSRSNHIPQFIDAESKDNNTVVIHLYDVIDGHTSTCNWYTVNRFTGQGTDTLGNPVALNSPAAELWNPDVSARRQLAEGEFCGVLYLGTFPMSYQPENAALREVFLQSGFSEAHAWITDIPLQNYAETPGHEFYLIIPRDSEAHVVVTEVDAVNGTERGRILSTYNGAPILLRCNVSEVASDVKIQITDNSGEHPAFSPYLSGMDGSPMTDCDKVRVFSQPKPQPQS